VLEVQEKSFGEERELMVHILQSTHFTAQMTRRVKLAEDVEGERESMVLIVLIVTIGLLQTAFNRNQ